MFSLSRNYVDSDLHLPGHRGGLHRPGDPQPARAISGVNGVGGPVRPHRPERLHLFEAIYSGRHTDQLMDHRRDLDPKDLLNVLSPITPRLTPRHGRQDAALVPEPAHTCRTVIEPARAGSGSTSVSCGDTASSSSSWPGGTSRSATSRRSSARPGPSSSRLMMMVVFTVFFGRMAKVPSGGLPYPLFASPGCSPGRSSPRPSPTPATASSAPSG